MRCPGLSVPANDVCYTLFPKPINHLTHLPVTAESLQVVEVDNHQIRVTAATSDAPQQKPMKISP